jgi:hypothetical protein
LQINVSGFVDQNTRIHGGRIKYPSFLMIFAHSISAESEEGYFFGSIELIKQEGEPYAEVTDGQHRHRLGKTMRQGKEGDFDYLLVIETISETGSRGAQQSASDILSRAFHIPAGKLSFDLSVRHVIYGETKFEAEQL